MKRKQLLLALVVAAAYACSPGTDEQKQPVTTSSTPARDTAHVMAGDTSAHAAHMQAAGDTAHGAHSAPSAGAHAAHEAAAATDHGQHAAVAAGRAEHAQHAAAAQHDTTHQMPAHAQHDTTQQTPAHAQHDTTQQTPAHAQHDTTQQTPAHAQHDTTQQTPAHAQHDAAQHDTAQHAGMQGAQHGEMMSNMLMAQLGPFSLMAMGQIFPAFTFALPRSDDSPLDRTGLYLTQPAIMANLSSKDSRVVLRTTLNFEGMTQPEGELTFGGWGEGFIDKRHPHTLLHEAMLSYNVWSGTNGFSLSAGKGFAPYGTDDPMSRPVLKYPTNHHLSQALERWTIIGTALVEKWSLEASVFGGNEPTSPYDFSNIEPFGNSWSARVARRFGTGSMATWPWEISVSHASIVETHDGESERTRLYNGAIRHEHDHGDVHHYALVEYSRSESEHDEPYYSLLGEVSARFGANLPYARAEYATRPEYEREGAPTTEEFFRYHHDDEPIGATRWLILSAGYGRTLATGKLSPRPFVEAQYNRVWSERGATDPADLFGRSSFWSISAGVRIFLGGEPMRMGSYGVLDPMTAMHRQPTTHQMSTHRH